MTLTVPSIIDLSDDIDELLMTSLAEVNGKPVLHLAVSLKTHREYDPAITAILLNGLPPRMLFPQQSVAGITAPEAAFIAPVPVVEQPTQVQEAAPPEPAVQEAPVPELPPIAQAPDPQQGASTDVQEAPAAVPPDTALEATP